MELNYRPSESTVKPTVIEMGKHSVFVRRNIMEDIRSDENGQKTSYWVYEEACLKPSEFNAYIEYVSAQNAVNGVDDSGNILTLLSGQDNSNNNQMIVMEAIADLYDIIAMLM